MCSYVYILIILILLPWHTVANVQFVTEPPEKVSTFPGQNVTLPCVLEDLISNHHIVQWARNENFEMQNISKDREVFIPNIENFGHFSILGDGMNYTLLINIVEPEFENNNNIVKHNIGCFVLDPYVNKMRLSSTSEISIQKFIAPVCGKVQTYYVIGDTLTLGCYIDSDPTTVTTLKSGNGEVLLTEFNGSHIIYNLIVTKKDHGAIFEFESRKNGTNEMRSCSMGPITVYYKPEINITQTSATEFYCTAEARPPIDVMHWIVESSIPKDVFMISNNVLKFNEPLEVDSETKITCEAENTIGKGNETLSIPVVNNRDEEDGSSIIVIIVVSVLLCSVIVFVIVSLYLYKSHRSKVLTTLYDDTIVDQTSMEEDGYQIPLKSVRRHYQSLKVADSMNTKEDEKVVGYDDIDLPNEEGQSLEVTSSSAVYVNTLDNKNRYRMNNIESDSTSNAKGEEVTYVNNAHVKKCQFPGNVHPTYIGNEEYVDKKTDIDYETVPNLVTPDTDYETVPNLVTPDNTNNKSSHHSETTADVHYINSKIKAPQLGR